MKKIREGHGKTGSYGVKYGNRVLGKTVDEILIKDKLIVSSSEARYLTYH